MNSKKNIAEQSIQEKWDHDGVTFSIGNSWLDIKIWPPLTHDRGSFHKGEIIAVPSLKSNNPKHAVLLLKKLHEATPKLHERGVVGLQFETSNQNIIKRFNRKGAAIHDVSEKIAEQTRMFYKAGMDAFGFSPNHLKSPVKSVSLRIHRLK